jgi:hypothetical protein
MRALSLSNLRHVKSAVIGHPKRNSTPKKTASTLRNVPKTAAKCKLEGQSRTLSRWTQNALIDQETGFSAGDRWRRCKRTDNQLLARRGI